MGEMGMFGHVPTAEEAHARAFAQSRAVQEQWSWAAYCAGLADAGVDDAQAAQIMFAALNGEFAHNVEPIFDDELDGARDPYDEIDGLREIIADLWERASFTMTDENREGWLERLRDAGCEVGE